MSIARKLLVVEDLMRERLRPVRHFKFEELADSDLNRDKEVEPWQIPPVVYQTLESRSLDVRHRSHSLIFREINPSLSFKLFDARQRDEYIFENWGSHEVAKIYRDSLFPVMKADIFRYCVIYDNGGYYVDATKGIFTSLRTLHSPTDAGLISYENNVAAVLPDMEVASLMKCPTQYVINWAFGFVAKHKVLELMIQNIVEYSDLFVRQTYSHPKTASLALSATGMFTKTVRDYLGKFGAKDLAQADRDFNGTGLFRLRGANNPWPPVPHHYSEARDSSILK